MEIPNDILEWEKGQDIFTVKGAHHVNHKPHPYTIGPAHVNHASDKHSGRLGYETVRAVKCAHPHCNLSYDEHTYDTVLFLQLRRNATEDEASSTLKPTAPMMEAAKIDGITFVETPEKFRIQFQH